MRREEIFQTLGLSDHNCGVYAGGWLEPHGAELTSENPTTTEPIAVVRQAGDD